jgi:competence protein ComFB
MDLNNMYDFDKLKNEAEVMVIREMEVQLEKEPEEVCRCEECVLDIAALALNTVSPLYRISLLGTQYAHQAINQKEYAVSVKQAVAKAIKKVRGNPAHD